MTTQNTLKKIVIIGASSSMAEHCARIWASQAPVDLVLVARNAEKAKVIADDILVRSPSSKATIKQVDFLSAPNIAQLIDAIFLEGKVDVALIAHGALLDQTDCQENLQVCEDSLKVNGLSPVLFAEAFAGKMQQLNHGTIAIIGSVAGDRGRKSNYVYGAAKGLVTRYAQGLQHRFAASNVKIVLVKPGPTATPMTANMQAQGAKLASVEQVAAAIVNGVEKNKRVIYAPAKWALIMIIIRHLPHFIFKKLNI